MSEDGMRETVVLRLQLTEAITPWRRNLFGSRNQNPLAQLTNVTSFAIDPQAHKRWRVLYRARFPMARGAPSSPKKFKVASEPPPVLIRMNWV